MISLFFLSVTKHIPSLSFIVILEVSQRKGNKASWAVAPHPHVGPFITNCDHYRPIRPTKKDIKNKNASVANFSFLDSPHCCYLWEPSQPTFSKRWTPLGPHLDAFQVGLLVTWVPLPVVWSVTPDHCPIPLITMTSRQVLWSYRYHCPDSLLNILN